MFGKYVASCYECNTEFEFKHVKKYKKFINNNSTCPCCGSKLSTVPLLHIMITPPPELKLYPLYTRRIDMENNHPILAFSKWPKLSENSKYPNTKEN